MYGSHRGTERYDDGVYIIKKDDISVQPVYCDMTSDPGAWTLLITSITGGWGYEQVNMNEKYEEYSVHICMKFGQYFS